MEEKEHVLLLEKGKIGLQRAIFGRTLIICALLVLQLVMMLVALNLLSERIPWLWGFMVAISVVVGILMLNTDSNPSVKITWLLIITLLPVFGALLYLFVQTDVGHRALSRRMEEITAETRRLLPASEEVRAEVMENNPEVHQLTNYVNRSGCYPLFKNTAVTYFPQGEDKFQTLLEELEKAEKFIFLEYFIIDEGYMWGRVLDILARKARQGVEVRLMYDGTNEFVRLPHSYPAELAELGIKCRIFAPLKPFVSTHYNYRDHRKILVIDGHTAFTGGINLADEYINRKERFGHWKDTAVMLQGEGVSSFTLMFLQIWNLVDKEPVFEPWVSADPRPRLDAEGYVLPFGDCPVDNDKVGEMIYLDILNRAEKYVHIMTPYLILDGETETAIKFAAQRGVDVKLILPHIPDKQYAFALAKTHYKTLLDAGVEIYEYTPGFVHAKVFVSDDKKGVVGTVNLDYRSLYHHFECGVYLYGVPELAAVEQDVQDTLKRCQKITHQDVKNMPFGTRLSGALLKVMAPLL